MKSVGIIGTGAYVPDRILTNAELEQMVDTTDEWVVSRTGIRERRIISEGEASSDLAVKAAIQALENAKLEVEDLDLIIVATVTPDMFFPATSCIVQKEIGANHAAAFDLSAACSGFVYGVATATQFIQTGFYRNALVIGVDALSTIVDWKDRSTCILFGDGAGAAVLTAVEDGYGFLSHELGSAGEKGELLQVPAGGSRLPASETTVKEGLHYLSMAGKEVFKFAVRVINSATEKALQKAGLTKEDIDFFVPHQANIRIIDSAMKRFGLPEEKVIVNVDRYGNMSAASVPVALHEAVSQNRIHKGDILALCAFGGGLSWGASILKWSQEGGKEDE